MRLPAALNRRFALGRRVGCRIEHDAQLFQSGAHGRANCATPFSPMPPVKTIASAPPSSTSIRAEIMPHVGDEHVERQPGPLRCRRRPLPPGRARRRCAAQARASRCARPDRRALRSSDLPVCLHHHRHGERIEIADAVVLRQARLRAHAHAGGHALAVANRTQRTRAAQVARDDPQIARARAALPSAWRCSDGWRRESPSGERDASRPTRTARRSTESRSGIVCVKAGFERRHQRNLRQLLAQQPHGRDVGRIVGRRHVVHFLHRRQHVRRHPLHAADRPPCTALKPMAATSTASCKQPSAGSVSCSRHMRTATA